MSGTSRIATRLLLAAAPAATAAAMLALSLRPAPLAAQGGSQVRVELDRAELPAKPDPSAQVEVTIHINIPTTPAPPEGGRPIPGEAGDPSFTVSASEGTLTLDSRHPRPQARAGRPEDELSFTLPRPRDGYNRTVGKLHYIYKPPADPEPGMVTISVEGGQGMALLGVREQSLPTFRGSAQLVLTAVKGGRAPRAPGGLPPGGLTPASVNPPAEVIDRLGPMIALLGPIALLNWALTRPSKPKKPKGKPKDKTPPPLAKEPPEVEAPPSGCDLVVMTLSEPHLGNDDYVLHLRVSAVPAAGTTAKLVGGVRWGAQVGPPGRATPDAEGNYQKNSLDASGYTRVGPEKGAPKFPPIDADGADHQHFQLTLPWEWLDVDVTLSVTAMVELTSPKGEKKTPPPVTGTGTFHVVGANPELTLTASPAVVNATGRDKTEIQVARLELFGKSADRTKVKITAAKVARPEGAAEWQDGEWWKRFERAGEKAFWTPPFLLQEPGHAELFDLEVKCTYQREGHPPSPMPPAPCEVTLLGCQPEVWSQGKRLNWTKDLSPDGLAKDPVVPGTGDAGAPIVGADTPGRGPYFVPVPRAPVLAGGRLTCAGKGVQDPFGEGAVHHPKAAIRCEVYDLSQGRPKLSGEGMPKLPARHPMDVGPLDPRAMEPEALKKRTEAILGDRQKAPLVNRPAVAVERDGHFFTPGAPSILLWTYERREGCEPVDNAPVVFKLFVEDGLGGRVELRDALYPVLGNLVMETGGPDFRIFESRPFRFEVHYEHPLAYVPESEVALVWEFAFVDREGKPLRSATPAGKPLPDPTAPRSGVVTSARVDSAHTTQAIVVGHMPDDRDVYIAAKDGEVRTVPRGKPAPGGDFRLVEPHERAHSTALRSEWHTAIQAPGSGLAEGERGLAWLKDVDPIEWTDDTTLLAVRVEMRTKDGHLVATSDRLAPAGLADVPGASGYAGRTPPDFVWRDHQFAFVVLKLRLRLQDDTGQPYASGASHPSPQHRYRLELGGDGKDGKTGPQGEIEVLVPPAGPDREAQEATLLLLSPDGKPNGAELHLRLGALDPVSEESGVAARLNNLGLHAGKIAGEAKDPLLKRAVQRFQALRRLAPTGRLEDVRRPLQEAHDETGAVLAPDVKGPVVPFELVVDYSVAQQRRAEPVEDPDDPNPQEALVKREACVALHLPNTLRIPGDPRRQWVAEPARATPRESRGLAPGYRQPAREVDRWLLVDKAPPGDTPPMGPVTSENEVRYLIDGPETFAAMVEAIRATSGRGDYIYLTGLYLDVDFNLIPGDDTSSMRRLLGDAAGFPVQGVELLAIQEMAEKALDAARAAAQDVALAAVEPPTLQGLSRMGRRLLDTTSALRDAAAAARAAARAAEEQDKFDPSIAAARAAAAAAETANQDAFAAGAFVRDYAAQPSGIGSAEAAGRVVATAQRGMKAALDAVQAAHDRVAECSRAVSKRAPGRGVQVRALLWRNYRPGCWEWSLAGVRHIHLLAEGAAFHDPFTESLTGSHHQKILVVKHGGELTAFIGGLDINPDRLITYEDQKLPQPFPRESAVFHDVHCRIRGPAARDVLQAFIDRWDNHPGHVAVDKERGDLLGRSEPRPAPRPKGRQMVQIGRTLGIPRDRVGNPLAGTPEVRIGEGLDFRLRYACAPNGERTAWRMIRNAIRQAERYIYVEDQYLISKDASREIHQRLKSRPSLEHVTILVPSNKHTDLGGMEGKWRAEFLGDLQRDFPEKVRVFILEQGPQGAFPQDWHTYVHAKIWIVDDRFAIIGSANCCDRSYTNDSEAVAGIFDESSDERCAYHFAHQLRVALWAEHLNMDTPEGHAELSDGVASAVHWLRPPSGARVRPFVGSGMSLGSAIDPVKTKTTVDPRGMGSEPPDP